MILFNRILALIISIVAVAILFKGGDLDQLRALIVLPLTYSLLIMSEVLEIKEKLEDKS